MMDFILIIFISLAGVVIVLVGTKYLRLKAKLVGEYAEYSKAFYESANTLLNDDEMPVEFIALTKWMNETVDSADVVKVLATSPSRMKTSSRAQKYTAVMADFFKRRPELEDTYRKCIVSWFGAVTSISPFYGMMARYAVQENTRETSVIRAASRIEKKKHSNNDGPPISGEPIAA